MTMTSPYRVVLVTAPDGKTAHKIARGLVEEKLAACVNVVAGMESHYRWEGRMERSEELLLLIKTRAALVPDVTYYVQANHSYSVPEVIALPILEGSRAYLSWIGANTRFAKTNA